MSLIGSWHETRPGLVTRVISCPRCLLLLPSGRKVEAPVLPAACSSGMGRWGAASALRAALAQRLHARFIPASSRRMGPAIQSEGAGPWATEAEMGRALRAGTRPRSLSHGAFWVLSRDPNQTCGTHSRLCSAAPLRIPPASQRSLLTAASQQPAGPVPSPRSGGQSSACPRPASSGRGG